MSALRLLLLAAYSLPPCLREARGMKERGQGEGARRGSKQARERERGAKCETGKGNRSECKKRIDSVLTAWEFAE